MVTRRRFLATHVSGTLISFVPGAAIGRVLLSEDKKEISLAELSLSTFENLTDTTFSIQFEVANNVDAELIEVTGKKQMPAIEQFSLVFKVNQEQVYPQGMYPINHKVLGQFELFIVPVEASSDEVRYEAVFSRLKKDTAVSPR